MTGCFEPSNFPVIDCRYEWRIVSGFATEATWARVLRPNFLPIPASVPRSGFDSRNRDGKCDCRIQFSVARYFDPVAVDPNSPVPSRTKQTGHLVFFLHSPASSQLNGFKTAFEFFDQTGSSARTA